MSPGYHVIKWNASADNAKFKSNDVTFTVKVVRGQALYYVIDLSGGASATSYRVKEIADMPIDGWTDEYKTTKMVLRRIEAGTFRTQYRHDVTLTSPFLIGVFEVTQKQYELVTGENPSRYNGEMRPVERVSYDMIRGSSAGAGWPIDNAVDADSFLGKLRRRTGLDFDLPTEAQWEHACRAGTTTYYNNGGASEDDLKTLGRYWGNCSDGKGGYTDAHTKVGSYLPNAWGLYDMHGNVREWCLDWENGILGDMTDPKGADTGSYRVECGGSYYGTAYDCSASYHGSWKPSSVGSEVGFRLAKSIRNDETFSDIDEETFAPVSFGGMSVDTTFIEGTKVGPSILISYGSVGAAGCKISANGTEIVNSKESGLKEWALTELGTNSLMYSGGVVMESSVLAMCYWIVFDPNGGSPTPSASLKWKDTPYDSLPTVTRKGCKFLGWFTDVSGGTRVTEDTIVDSERTLYAHWEPIMHTIVFDSRGGSEVASSSMQEEFTYGDLPTPVRDGLLFFGWYTSPEGGERIVSDSTVDSDRTLYARWIGVSNIEVFSGCPWQEVVIGYTITGGGDESIPVELQVSAKDNEHEKMYEGVTLVGVDLTEGQHMIKWNASADGSKFKSEDVIFSVKLLSTPQASGSQGDNNGNTMASVEALSGCVGVDTTFGAPVAADGVVHVAYGSVDDLVGCRILADGEELVAATKRGSLAWVAKDGVILEWTSGALTMQSEVKVGLIANVGVFSSWPWKDVLIGYTISGPTATPKDYLEVIATDNATGKKYECKTLEGVDITPGTHVIRWNASEDGAKFKSEDVDFTLRIVSPPSPLYCVVDLSGGADVVSYPVTYLDAEPEGGWAKEYKTQKLVLRRIGAGSFKMQGMMTTTISKPFYMGVFEVTQGQWELVMGSNPCSSTPNCGPAYPVHYVSYNTIRGEGGLWPSSTAVDASSFVGRLQARTGLGFDLPTEAQWEYACRAGTTTTYYWGNTIDGNYAWSRNNWSSQWAHPVGALLPNAWGLYDMSGNVWEWCLDWHGALKYGTDPKGVETGSLRVIRGGNWYSSESWCTSSCREPNLPSSDYHDPSATYGMYHIGFRLSRSIQDER